MDLEAWHDCHVITGGSAAALVGLLFVVISVGPALGSRKLAAGILILDDRAEALKVVGAAVIALIALGLRNAVGPRQLHGAPHGGGAGQARAGGAPLIRDQPGPTNQSRNISISISPP